MKIHKFDCLGRVPSSIEDLKKCEMCVNEEICMGLASGAYAGTAEHTLDASSYHQPPQEQYPLNKWEK